MALCSKCGKELADDANFCSNCGTPVNGTAKSEKKIDSTFVKEKAKEFGGKAKNAIDKLPFNEMVQKVPALEKFAKFANYVVCAVGVLLLVVVISAITPDKKGEKSKSGKTAVEKTAKKKDSGKEKVAKENEGEKELSLKSVESSIKKEFGLTAQEVIAAYAAKQNLDEDTLAETLKNYEIAEESGKVEILEELKKTFLVNLDTSDKTAVKQLINDGKKKVKGVEKQVAKLTSEYKSFLKEADDILSKAGKTEESLKLKESKNSLKDKCDVTPEEYITAATMHKGFLGSGYNDDMLLETLTDYVMGNDEEKLSIINSADTEFFLYYKPDEYDSYAEQFSSLFSEAKIKVKVLEKKVKPHIAERNMAKKAAEEISAKFDEYIKNAFNTPAAEAINFEYQISKDGKSVVINALKKDFKDSVLVVPSVIEDMPVKDCKLGSKINCKFLVYQEGIEKVDLPNNSESVLYIYFPSTVKDFYKERVDAYEVLIECYKMPNLLRVDFAPESQLGQLEKLPHFKNCEKLSSVTLPASIKNLCAISGSDIWNKILFSNCDFTSFVVPEGVVTVKGLFANCKNLTSITFPSTLEEIGELTVVNCNKLKSIILKYN